MGTVAPADIFSFNPYEGLEVIATGKVLAVPLGGLASRFNPYEGLEVIATRVTVQKRLRLLGRLFQSL